jgi:hypothetical protein
MLLNFYELYNEINNSSQFKSVDTGNSYGGATKSLQDYYKSMVGKRLTMDFFMI